MAHANATHPAPAVSASDRIREHPEVVWPLDREFPGRSDATLHDSLVRLAPFFSPLDPADAASVRSANANLLRSAVARARRILANPRPRIRSRLRG